MRYYMTFRPFSQGAGFAVIFVAFVPHKEFCFHPAPGDAAVEKPFAKPTRPTPERPIKMITRGNLKC